MPGKIAPGTSSDLLAYFPDLLPTFAKLTQATMPSNVDGISILPTLTGQNAAQKIHDYLYWEINGWTAIRQGQWRVVKPDKAKTWELYDLASDPSESKDLASAPPSQPAPMNPFAKAPSPAPTSTSATAAPNTASRMTPVTSPPQAACRRRE